MKRAAKGGKSVQLTIGIWWDPARRVIHIRGERDGPLLISTVSANPKHERGNPNLFHKLAAYLRAAGAPAPPEPAPKPGKMRAAA
ncbi:MAG: hypothetical protein ACRETJ_08415 [Steroidobacteraceae bacterium]